MTGRWLPAALLALAFTMPPSLAQETRVVPQNEAQIQLSFAPVVKEVMPSVVNVYATRFTGGVVSPFAGDPFFRRFFGPDAPFFERRPRESRDLGSGVIVDSSGVILTNSHVVHGADDIRIQTADNREYGVDLILDDPRDDLAVLRIRDPGGRSFPALDFANSDRLEVGDLVLAIGNPFGVGQTVTSGIVSAIARTSITGEESQFFIQTDAAINPGNSGGALVNMQGDLVGINTAIFSTSGGSVGIGFAIPANLARMVTEAALSGKPLQRAWFGARLQPLTSDLAASLGIDPPQGALVTEVAPSGPAVEAGLQPGDVIVAIGENRVADPQEFAYRFAIHPLDADARLTVLRNGASVSLSLRVAPAPPPEAVTITGDTRFAGTTAANLTPAFADELGLPYDSRGVVVSDVAPNSPAAMLGLQRGDIILNLQGRDITGIEEFRATATARPRAWQVILQRGGRIIRSIVEG